MATGPHRDHAVVLGEPRHHAGVDEARLAGAGRPEHGDHRRADQPIRERLDLALAADEALGIGDAVRGEARIRRDVVGVIVRGVGVLGGQRGEPLAGGVVVALEAPRRGDQACGAAPAAPQQEQLGLRARQRRDHLRERRLPRDHAAGRVDQRELAVRERLAPHDDRRSRSRRRGPCQLTAAARRRRRAGTRASARSGAAPRPPTRHRSRASSACAADRDRRAAMRAPRARRCPRARRREPGQRAAAAGRRDRDARELEPWLRVVAADDAPRARAHLGCRGRVRAAGQARERDDREPATRDRDEVAQRGVALDRGRGRGEPRHGIGDRLRPAAQPHVAGVRVEQRHRLGRRRVGREPHGFAKRERGLPARAGRLLERAQHGVRDRRRDARGHRRRRLAQVRRREQPAVGVAERQVAAQAAIRERAERVDVGARVDLRCVLPLLGRHVVRRAERRAVLGELALVDGVDRGSAAAWFGGLADRVRLRDAKIEELGQQLAGAVDDHHVAGLDVAMDDAELVSGVHDLAQPAEQRREHAARHRASPFEQRVERRAAHVLHRDPQHAVGLDAERVHMRGVRMVERRGETRFAQEALDARRRAVRIAAQDLDHRAAAELRLLRAEHVARAAAAELIDGTVNLPSVRPISEPEVMRAPRAPARRRARPKRRPRRRARRSVRPARGVSIARRAAAIRAHVLACPPCVQRGGWPSRAPSRAVGFRGRSCSATAAAAMVARPMRPARPARCSRSRRASPDPAT